MFYLHKGIPHRGRLCVKAKNGNGFKTAAEIASGQIALVCCRQL